MLNTTICLDLNMGLNGFTPYEKLKELQGGKISKDFKVSNILPSQQNFSFWYK